MKFDFGFGLFLAGMAFVVATVLASCLAPCSWFAGAPAKDVPARCWGELVGGDR